LLKALVSGNSPCHCVTWQSSMPSRPIPGGENHLISRRFPRITRVSLHSSLWLHTSVLILLFIYDALLLFFIIIAGDLMCCFKPSKYSQIPLAFTVHIHYAFQILHSRCNLNIACATHIKILSLLEVCPGRLLEAFQSQFTLTELMGFFSKRS